MYQEAQNGTVEEVTRFWRHVFGGECGLLHLWTAKRGAGTGKIDQKTIGSANFNYPAAADEAAKWGLEKSEEGREVYFCAHLLTQPRRIKANAGPVLTLWGDLDGAPLPNSGLKPTAVVESSPGRYHAYWRLDTEIPPKAAEELNKRIATAINADESGFDLSQLLRVPGTTNYKHEGEPAVRLLDLDGTRSYNAAQLDALLPKTEENSKNGAPEEGGDDPPVRLPTWGLRYWHGEDYVRSADGELDRSRSLYKIAALLAEHGATRRVIVDALAERDANLGWHKYSEREDRDVRYGEIADKVERGESVPDPDPVASDTPVDGTELLEKLTRFIRRFVILREEQAQLVALWVVHTHAFDAAETTPYLHIKSAEKRSGKSRLLEVLELLAERAWYTGRVTPAVLIRKIAAETPTLLLDESDAAFNASQEYTETLRGVLNAGFRRGGVASLCVGQGANISYQDFPVYSPKAIGGIGRLPHTVADRSIPIDLKRKTKGERVARFRRRKVEVEALPLRDRVAAWVEAVGIEELASREVELPEVLDDRAQDIVEPLLAIADVVGGEWPEVAREAASKLLTREEREEQDSLGVRLLADIKAVFEQGQEHTIRSSFVVAELRKLEEAPWDSYKGTGLTAQRMAQLLQPFGIKSKKVRQGDKTFQGFEQKQFADAWARYLADHEEPTEGDEKPTPKGSNPLVPPSQVGTSEHSHTYADYGGSQVGTRSEQKTRSEHSDADTYHDVPTFRLEGVYTGDGDPNERWEGEL